MARYPLNLPPELHQEAARLAQRQGISLNPFILWSVAEMPSELRHTPDDPASPRLTHRRGAAGQLTPVIRATRLRVQTIGDAAQDWGMSAAEIASEYGLTE